MLSWYRRTVRRIGRFLRENIWVVLMALVAVGVVVFFTAHDESTALQPDVLNLTLNAASTQSSIYVPTLAAGLTRTPFEAALTNAAPTLELAGRLEVRQFAASAEATSQRDTLDQGAIQAVGPPNTPECGDFRTAWASADPNGTASLTLMYAELVTPTGVMIYETYNPGFITRVTFTDIYGRVHTIYEATPQPRPWCPFTLVIPIIDADYKGSVVTIYVDQRTSPGGWDQIDAVELVGIKH